MKYIKKYENTLYKYYWMIPTDDRLEKSLEDIGCSIKFIKDILFYKRNRHIPKYIYVGCFSYLDRDDNSKWGYTKIDYKTNYYEENDYEYKGEVNMYDGEIEANKYNI